MLLKVCRNFILNANIFIVGINCFKTRESWKYSAWICSLEQMMPLILHDLRCEALVLILFALPDTDRQDVFVYLGSSWITWGWLFVLPLINSFWMWNSWTVGTLQFMYCLLRQRMWVSRSVTEYWESLLCTAFCYFWSNSLLDKCLFFYLCHLYC